MEQKQILYGGDYNPEQWLDTPEILEQDIAYMKEAGINTVTLGVFSWAMLEPSEGNYQIDWLERIVGRLYKEGIATILGTPSGARPKWMSDAYPEVLRTEADRRRNLFGGRHNHCFTSPVYREKVRQINLVLGSRFSSNPAVKMWHISNEFSGECHCSLCQTAFRDWLRKKYKTIEELNQSWCTAFWSHLYTSFDQIESPSPLGESAVHGLNLDWKRFVTDQTADFVEWEIKALRETGAKQPATVNLMYDFQGLNYDKIAACVDVISWDSYPVWHKNEDIETALDNGLQHDYMRCLKHQPFLLMESSPSSTNWQGVSKLKRPGLLTAASLQALAHGSDSVLFFQIRQSRGSSEKFHGAVIDHSGRNDTRVFREVKQLGADLGSLTEILGSRSDAEVALIYDIENRWAMQDAQGPRNDGMYYHESVMKSYTALRRLGLNVDVISEGQDIKPYKLVIGPMLYMFREGIEKKIRDFVEGGGQFVMTYWSGIVDESDRCYMGGTPYGLMDVFGLRRTETDGLYDGEVNCMLPVSGEIMSGIYECRNLCDLLETKEAVSFMTYGSEFYQGTGAAAKNKYGLGTAYYIGADVEQNFYEELYKTIVGDAGIERIVDGNIPHGLEVSSRKKEGKEYIFIQNFKNETVDIHEMALRGVLLYGENTEQLRPYAGIVLKR